jgi:hypothetical protein
MSDPGSHPPHPHRSAGPGEALAGRVAIGYQYRLNRPLVTAAGRNRPTSVWIGHI